MDIQTAIWQSPLTQTVAINATSPGTTTIFTPDAGKRFACHYLFLQFGGATTGTVEFESNTTPISGVFNYDGTPSSNDVGSVQLCCAGMPILVGINNGDNFNMVLVNVGGAMEVDGFALMTQIGGVDA